MYEKLSNVVEQSEIWKGARRSSHSFLLSPSVYYLSENKCQELSALGLALHDCLLGLSHIAVIAYDQELNYKGPWGLARRVFSTGVPKVYQGLQGINPRHIPRLLKVDFMIDESDNFKIAEIDGHNKHGLGYSTLGLRFREALFPVAKSFPGAVKTLSDEIGRLGHQELKLLYADQERFYIPEFEVAQQEFAKYGIRCLLQAESETEEDFMKEGLFLDLPFLYHKPSLYETACQAYRQGGIEFIIPPKPFLGAKGVLALLRNDSLDEDLESLLGAFIRKSSLKLVRHYIPETRLVGKQANGKESVRALTDQKRYVLKESISSGMKGTVFSDDPDFESVLLRASSANMNWILQEEIINQPQIFSYFENGEAEPQLRTSDDWFMRVTVQYINRKLGDVIVTARKDKAVHGAKDCIQIGTVLL